MIISSHNQSLAKNLMKDGFLPKHFQSHHDVSTGLPQFNYQMADGLETQTNAKELLRNYSFPDIIHEMISKN